MRNVAVLGIVVVMAVMLSACSQKKMAQVQVNAGEETALNVKVLSGEAALQDEYAALMLIDGSGIQKHEDAQEENVADTPEPVPPATGAEHEQQEPVDGIFTYQNYAGLGELVTLICDDAGQIFSSFYGPTLVRVRPFVFVENNGQKSISMLGATLADQMAAMVNNYPVNLELQGYAEQHLKGVLQEVDGFLRIHISGANQAARRRSYTAQIEMSEGLYRALHSHYITAGM